MFGDAERVADVDVLGLFAFRHEGEIDMSICGGDMPGLLCGVGIVVESCRTEPMQRAINPCAALIPLRVIPGPGTCRSGFDRKTQAAAV